MSKKKGGVGQTAGYVLLGLLLLGLGGFGATNFGGTVRSVGSVGDADIPAPDYFRAVQNEMRALEAQIGQPLSFQQARELGLTELVLSRVVTAAALEHEAAQLGISVGDERLASELRNISAFQGIDGQFNREAYRLSLENAGFSEREFEESLRADSASTLLQGAVQTGIRLPDSYAKTLIAFTGERRSFTWAELGDDLMSTGIPVPSDDDLKAFYEDNIADYTRPETKNITFAWLAPQMIVDTVEVEEARLRDAYEERNAEFNMPERRLVERLVMPDAAAAQDALDRITAGDASFEDVVAERELDLADVDLGDVNLSELGAAGETVFAANVGDVVQAASDFGPALFRINAVLAAQNTSYEEALPDLRDELALDAARRAISAQAQGFDDELAAGVTLEELADTTDLQLGQIGWTGNNAEDIAGYEGFMEAANAVQAEDYPAIADLGDGGVFALRLDEIQEAAPYDFDDIRARVLTDWEADAKANALLEEADLLSARLKEGASFEDIGLTARAETNLTRTSFGVPLPEGALEQAFDLAPGETTTLKGDGTAFLLRLDEILPAETEDAAAQQLVQLFDQQAQQDISQDLFRALAQDIQTRAGVVIDQAAINAVHANFQ